MFKLVVLVSCAISCFLTLSTRFTGQLGSLTLSEEVRNQETLKNQLKYEKRATRVADSAGAAFAVAGAASGMGGGVDGEGVCESDVVVDMVEVSGEKSGRGGECVVCCVMCCHLVNVMNCMS